MSFQEKPEVIRGRAAEIAVSRWLQGRGWAILPAYDYAGDDHDKAPRMEARERALVVPDLLAGRNGATAWFEVKRKTHADFTRITSRLWLVFVHDKEDEIRACEIGEVEFAECPHGRTGRAIRWYGGREMGHSGMVFFCWPCLPTIARTSVVLAQAA